MRVVKRGRSLVLSLCTAVAVLASPPGATPAGAADSVPPAPRADVSAPAVSGQLVIKFRRGTPPSTRLAAVQGQGGRAFKRIATLDVEAVEFPALSGSAGARLREALINALKRHPSVEFVEPNYIYRVSYTPNDPGRGSQYAWDRIQAYGAWETTRGRPEAVIAVVDTGIQAGHPDLDAKLVPGYDYVDDGTPPDDGNGHGTHVAGTVAAETNNGTGGAGTCPECKLMPLRVLDNSGSGTLVDVASGITYAADHGAQVINLSLGGGGSTTLQQAVDYAWGKGAFLACAAGNANTSATSNAYPAAYEHCFAVASTDSADRRSSFSNYGSWVEGAAPGSSIYSTWNNGGYNTISGTSMATPHVAGLAGLLASQGLTNAQIRQRLCDTADKIEGSGTWFTCGRINAQRAVATAVGDPPPPPPPPATTQVVVNGGFEDGRGPWVQSSGNGHDLIGANSPRSGASAAWLGGYNRASDTLYQTVTVPATGTLSYWWRVTTQETTGAARDRLRVRLYTTGGALLATLHTHSNADGAGTWHQEQISLAGYAGRTLHLRFEAATDNSRPTTFFVDDVGIQ
ncbi:MAG: S8 family peptidase [Chloroflexota bacterium]|nr:S8 family peptidase [Chloroflexota bacterium]